MSSFLEWRGRGAAELGVPPSRLELEESKKSLEEERRGWQGREDVGGEE
jgi:hypothetical protein